MVESTDLILQRMASLEYRLTKIEKRMKNLVPYKLDKRIEKLELWAEAQSFRNKRR